MKKIRFSRILHKDTNMLTQIICLKILRGLKNEREGWYFQRVQDSHHMNTGTEKKETGLAAYF